MCNFLINRWYYQQFAHAKNSFRLILDVIGACVFFSIAVTQGIDEKLRTGTLMWESKLLYLHLKNYLLSVWLDFSINCFSLDMLIDLNWRFLKSSNVSEIVKKRFFLYFRTGINVLTVCKRHSATSLPWNHLLCWQRGMVRSKITKIRSSQ